ncbi:MAG: ParB family chromosome partitioning protein [Bradymonadia bacterium]|jgi:ParB family chromosome partitioning protein
MSTRRTALGRGLSALIPDATPAERPMGARMLPLARIQPAGTQPRVMFNDARLVELSESIRANGLIQPIVVRRIDEHRFEIIAGERRYRASKLADLTEVAVVIRDVTDGEAYELALVENIQREDLDPIEEARAYRHLADLQGLTQEAMAQRVGKDRATVANALRLLKLPTEIQDAVSVGQLSAGHGRALLTCDADARLALGHKAMESGWSVRETERQARAQREADDAASSTDESPETPATAAVEAQLRSALGAPVRLVQRRGKGRIEVRFHSADELERLIDLLSTLEGR